MQNQEDPRDAEIVTNWSYVDQLCHFENDLLLNKLNDDYYTSVVVILSNYSSSDHEMSPLTKGFDFCSIPGAPGIGDILTSAALRKG